MVKLIVSAFLMLSLPVTYSQEIYCGRAVWESSNGVIASTGVPAFSMNGLNKTLIIKTKPKGKIYLESITLVDYITDASHTSTFINHVSKNTPDYDYWESTTTFPFQIVASGHNTNKSQGIYYRRISSENVDDSYLEHRNFQEYKISFIGEEGNSNLITDAGVGYDFLTRYLSKAEIEDVIEVPDLVAGESKLVSFGRLTTGQIIINGGGQYPSLGKNIPTNNAGVTIDLNPSRQSFQSYGDGLILKEREFKAGDGTIDLPIDIQAQVTATKDALGPFSRTFNVTVNCN